MDEKRKDYTQILARCQNDLLAVRKALTAACNCTDQDVHINVVPVLRDLQLMYERDVWKLKGKVQGSMIK